MTSHPRVAGDLEWRPEDQNITERPLISAKIPVRFQGKEAFALEPWHFTYLHHCSPLWIRRLIIRENFAFSATCVLCHCLLVSLAGRGPGEIFFLDGFYISFFTAPVFVFI